MKHIAQITTLLIFVLMISAVAQASGTRSAEVGGYCYLEGETEDLSGTKVVFTAVTPSAVTDSCYTVEEGNYVINLAEGMYGIRFTHEGYFPRSLPDEYLFENSSYTLPDVSLEPGQVMTVSGDVSGEWTADFLYQVVDDLAVREGYELLIHPGTEIQFMGNHEFLVEGGLFAAGAEGDSIRFTSGQPERSPGDWRGLRFGDTTENSGHGALQYCVIEYAGDTSGSQGWSVRFDYVSQPTSVENCLIHFSRNRGIYCHRTDSLTISGNTISDNGDRGIYLYNVFHSSSSTISGNTISDNGGNGICIYNSSPTISSNTISDNGNDGINLYISSSMISGNAISDSGHYGIYCESSSPTISSNTISDNEVRGISLIDSSPTISSNTISDNGETGIGCSGYSSPQIHNNIISSNENEWGGDGISIAENCSPEITYNDFWDNSDRPFSGDDAPVNIGEIITINANGDSCDTYFNIFLDPEYVDQAGRDYRLLVTSPCIDAGDPTSAPDADGTIVDIGASPYLYDYIDPPVIDFTGTPTSGSSPLGVDFTYSNYGGPIVSWNWSFGDGTTSSVPNPAHNYVVQEATFFPVVLTVTGPTGLQDTMAKIDYIGEVTPANFPPSPNFIGDPLVGYDCVQFTNQTIGQVDDYIWDFGNGDTSTEEHPNYCYPDIGTFTVSLTAGNAHGENTITKEDYITILPDDIPIANFTADPTSGVSPLVVNFTNTSIGTIERYEWDFGGDGTSTDENPVHVFETPGLYNVELIAFGISNNDTAYLEIEVLSAEAVITAIEDVPDDQGGVVYLTFNKSGYDTDDARSEMYSIERHDEGTWVSVMSSGAYGAESYTYEVTTVRDSTESDDGLTEFRVIANMDEGNFISDSSWGYSIDNLAPAQPTGFSFETTGGLTWDSAAESDFNHYTIYGSDVDHLDESAELLAQTTVTNLNVSSDPYHLFYLLTVVDHAGNESLEAAVPTDLTGLSSAIPDHCVLYSNIPNPFNPMTTLSFSIPTETLVRLTIYSVDGRLITTPVNETVSAGRHEITWTGRDLHGRAMPSGTYFYRLEAGGYVETKRMTLIR